MASLPLFYAGYVTFLRKTGGSLTRLRVWAFKGVPPVGIVMRLGLWAVRLLGRPALGLAMVRGYAKALRRLAGLSVALVGSTAILSAGRR